MTNINKLLQAAAGVSTVTNYQLQSWGYNPDGQLGLGNTTAYSSPKNVGSADPWTKIRASREGGATKSCAAAIKDGALYVWGDNTKGQLGLGNTTSYSSPKQVGSLTDWEDVGISGYHCLAVKTDGTLWAWGSGTNGSLGLNNTTDYSSPKQVGSLTNWASVAAGQKGDHSSAAIKTDGTLWTWGKKSEGE